MSGVEMTLFVGLTLRDGNPVEVNMALVTHFATAGTDTVLWFGREHAITVKESRDTVSSRWLAQKGP